MKQRIITVSISTFVFLFFLPQVKAQQTVPANIDSVAKDVKEMKAEMKAAKKLKLSGWIHAQFQVADQRGNETYAGGSNFNANVDKRFSVRRGRLKVIYDNKLSLYNIQIDISERGVQLREMFVKLTDPWLKSFYFTVGMFNRPFGYEISYSSNLRESPERARMSQTIFFNERDMGAWLTYQAPVTSAMHFLKLDAAIVSGTGITNVNNMGAAIFDPNKNTQNNTSGGNDFDFQKDFIGRISVEKESKSKKLTVSGGLSYYNGGYRMGNKQVWTSAVLPGDVNGFEVDSSESNMGSIARRKHYGADLQLKIESPLGTTTLRGEYIFGQMPGLGYRTFNATPFSQPLTPVYLRDFDGAYFYFVQRIVKSKHQVVVKYDWYDPNKKLKGKEITGLNGTTSTDIRFDTWGFGYLYDWDENVKLSVYYDMVKNESTLISSTDKLKDFSKDIRDNIITMRVQYKF